MYNMTGDIKRIKRYIKQNNPGYEVKNLPEIATQDNIGYESGYFSQREQLKRAIRESKGYKAMRDNEQW